MAARQRAMKLLDSGWMQADVAQAVGMHVRTVRQWGQHRREHGLQSLLADARGREAGDGRTLQKEQEKEMQKLIRDKLPDQLKLPFALWTRKAVAQLIEARYARRLPVRTMGEYLKRWGFTPQKPIQKAYEQQLEGGEEVAGRDLSRHRRAGQGGRCGDLLGRSDRGEQKSPMRRAATRPKDRRPR